MKNTKTTRLILMWNHPETKANYKIGLLGKHSNGYSFRYLKDDVEAACDAGFTILTGFPELEREYESPTLFALIERRIPSKSRKDFKDVVERFGLSDMDDVQWEYLRVTQGILATDRLSFVEPIAVSEGMFEVEFYVAGWGKYNVDQLVDHIEVGQPMVLLRDPVNPHDTFAVKVCTANQEALLVGYVPKPYNVPLFEWLKYNLLYNAEVIALSDAKQANRPVVLVRGSVPCDQNGNYLVSDEDPLIF